MKNRQVKKKLKSTAIGNLWLIMFRNSTKRYVSAAIKGIRTSAEFNSFAIDSWLADYELDQLYKIYNKRFSKKQIEDAIHPVNKFNYLIIKS